MRIFIFLPFLFLFNNCDSSHLIDREATVTLSSIFPFKMKSQYYQNVQIVNKSEESGVWNYQFIASVVDAEQEESDVDVEIDVLDGSGNRICPRTQATVNRSNNNIQVLECKSTTDFGALKVEVKAAPAGQSLQSIALHDFDLSNI